MERKYWTINFDEFSVCVNTNDLVMSEEVIDLAIKHGVIDKWDVEETSHLVVEDITEDEEMMKSWLEKSVEIND